MTIADKIFLEFDRKKFDKSGFPRPNDAGISSLVQLSLPHSLIAKVGKFYASNMSFWRIYYLQPRAYPAEYQLSNRLQPPCTEEAAKDMLRRLGETPREGAEPFVCTKQLLKYVLIEVLKDMNQDGKSRIIEVLIKTREILSPAEQLSRFSEFNGGLGEKQLRWQFLQWRVQLGVANLLQKKLFHMVLSFLGLCVVATSVKILASMVFFRNKSSTMGEIPVWVLLSPTILVPALDVYICKKILAMNILNPQSRVKKMVKSMKTWGSLGLSLFENAEMINALKDLSRDLSDGVLQAYIPLEQDRLLALNLPRLLESWYEYNLAGIR